MSVQNYKQTHIIGCKIDTYSREEVFSLLQLWMKEDQTKHIVTLNPEIALIGVKNDEYRKLINRADLTTADGIGLHYASYLFHTKIPARITGLSIVNALCTIAAHHRQSIYLLGGEGTTAKRASQRLKQRFPQLTIAGAESGPSKDTFNLEETGYIEKIIQAKPKIVLVAFGAPKQEEWIQKHKDLFQDGTILVGVGGVFDYLAGNVPMPPRLIRKLGLEWAYRLITQKKRFKRIIRATMIFPLTCLFWRLRIATTYRKNAVAMIYNTNGDILLVSPWWSQSIHWQFPQGGIDKGESPKEGVIREMQEELGTNKFIVQHKSAGIHRYIWPWSYRLIRGYKGQTQDLFILEFTGEDSDIDLESEGELTTFQWVPLDQVLSELAQPRKQLGRKALAFYTSVFKN